MYILYIRTTKEYMDKFEAVLLFSPEINADILKKEIDKFRTNLSTQEGKIINEEEWGLRDLSYNINKFKKAFYNYFQIEISGNYIKNLNKDLSQSENILRFLFIKVDKHQELPTKLNYEKK